MPKTPQKPSNKSFGWIVTGAVVAISIVLGAFFVNAVQNQEQERSTAVPAMSAGMGQPIVIGNADAKNTLTIFEDFQCPFCKRFEEFFSAAIFDAMEAGTAKVEVYPVAFLTPGSALASNAAACAADQGKYHEYHQALFFHQPKEEQGAQFTEELLLRLGGSAAMPDMDTFKRCVTTNRYGTWVSKLRDEMDRRDITGTPAVFVNGEKYDYSGKRVLDLAIALGAVDEADIKK